MKKRRGRPPHDDLLTPAEWRVVHAAQHGMSNREIAMRRGTSVDAVKYHVANVLGKLGLASRSDIRRWFRAPRGSALDGQEEKMDEAIPAGRIGQISRSVRDVAESQAWYRDVLGLPHLFTFGKLAFFDCDGTRLLLTQEGPVSQGESILYFLAGDIAARHRELAAKGVEFVAAPHMIHRHADGTEEWMAFFKDPEGRTLAIVSKVQPKKPAQ